MSSQDHTYLCKALFARLNQAVAQIQPAENSAVTRKCFIQADRIE